MAFRITDGVSVYQVHAKLCPFFVATPRFWRSIGRVGRLRTMRSSPPWDVLAAPLIPDRIQKNSGRASAPRQILRAGVDVLGMSSIGVHLQSRGAAHDSVQVLAQVPLESR